MREKIARAVRIGAREVAVPWADFVANVASEDPVAELRTQLAWNRAAIFDRLVGDAEIGTHHVAVGERASRTEIEASPAGAAMLAIRFRARLELDVGKNLGEKKVRAMIAIEEHGVFA